MMAIKGSCGGKAVLVLMRGRIKGMGDQEAGEGKVPVLAGGLKGSAPAEEDLGGRV